MVITQRSWTTLEPTFSGRFIRWITGQVSIPRVGSNIIYNFQNEGTLLLMLPETGWQAQERNNGSHKVSENRGRVRSLPVNLGTDVLLGLDGDVEEAGKKLALWVICPSLPNPFPAPSATWRGIRSITAAPSRAADKRLCLSRIVTSRESVACHHCTYSSRHCMTPHSKV